MDPSATVQVCVRRRCIARSRRYAPALPDSSIGSVVPACTDLRASTMPFDVHRSLVRRASSVRPMILGAPRVTKRPRMNTHDHDLDQRKAHCCCANVSCSLTSRLEAERLTAISIRSKQRARAVTEFSRHRIGQLRPVYHLCHSREGGNPAVFVVRSRSAPISATGSPPRGDDLPFALSCATILRNVGLFHQLVHREDRQQDRITMNKTTPPPR